MSAWSEMQRAALLGTRREDAQIPEIAPALDYLMERFESADGGHDLLRAAGLLDLYEQIGRAPAKVKPDTAPPLAAEERPPCPPRAAQYLAQTIDGPRRALLPEFLHALNEAGMRLPETLLPNILALGYTRATTRPLILAVLGRRGRWLAAHHDNWQYGAVDPSSWQNVRKTWENTSTARRATLVAQLRDIDSVQGRALIESTFRGENDQQRLRLIKQMQNGLSIADEPMLETALDDRSRLVRRQAADLLSRLPNSRLSRRLTSYVPHFLSWTPDDKQRITVSLPEVTPVMRRNGIVGSISAKPAHSRSQELIQLVGGVPLDYWQKNWGCDPRTLLRAVSDSLWPRTLTTGFSLAAVRQKNAAWAWIILDEVGITPVTAKCIAILSAAELQRLTETTLANQEGPTLDNKSELLNIIRLWQGTWNQELAQQMISTFFRHFVATADEQRPNSAVRERFLKLARQATPDLFDSASDLLGDVNSLGCWRDAAIEFLYTLRFRRDMLAALQNSGAAEKRS